MASNRVRLPVLAARVAEIADGVVQRTGRYHQQMHVLGEMGKSIACDISVARAGSPTSPPSSSSRACAAVRWCIEQGLEL